MAGEKVLIVEDELHALMGLAELVSGWGYRTETARDGAEALDKVMAWQPGIIVTDMKMPRMDGIELLNRLGELAGQAVRHPAYRAGLHRSRRRGHEARRL